MAITGTAIKNKKPLLVFLPICFSAILYLWSCGGDTPPDASKIDAAGTASAGVKIRWHHSDNLQEPGKIAVKAALDCQSGGVESIVCEVYDNAGNWLAVGGPWECMTGGGRINGIPAGSDRTIIVLAEDRDGNIRYHGQTSGIAIDANQVTEDIVIDTYPFIPRLIGPEDDAQIDPNTEAFEWEPSETAVEYLVQVAGDVDFDTLTINDIVPENTFLPSTLSPSMDYFWRVNAFDRFGNMGAASDIRSFTTSDCEYTISSSGDNFGSEGGSGSFEVTSSRTNCEWSASTGESWIEITAGTNGSDNATVSYTVAANTLSGQRTGVITAGGRRFTITQEGIACAYDIAPTGESFTSRGGSGTIRVTAVAGDCPWSASAGQTWIDITSGASGRGSGTVSYTIAANTLSEQRTGVITVGGRPFAVTQEGIACSYSIAPTGESFTSRGGSGTIRVTAAAGDCSWSASAGQTWIDITSGASGRGSGTVGYRVSAYTDTRDRTADISVAGRTCRITQTAAPDTIRPSVVITSPTSEADFTTDSAVLTINGNAEDNVGVTGVTWAGNQGNSGACSGTTTWQASDIALVPGENVITVTARDAAGNTGTDRLTVTRETVAPDYTVTDFSVTPAAAIAGSAVTVEYTAVNQGGAPDNCVNMAIFLSPDAAITTADTQLQSGPLPDCSLAAGQRISQRLQVTIPADFSAGDYYVGIIADVDDNQIESDESNNTAATPFTMEAAVPTLCSTTTEAGEDTPETFIIEMGQSAGTFLFEYETFSQEDDLIIRHDGVEIWRSGCIGTSGIRRQTISYSGEATHITVEVDPNCNGGSGTAWEFTAHCPEGGV